MSNTLKIEAFTNIEQLEKLRSVWNDFSYNTETDLDFFVSVITKRPEFLAPCILLARYHDKEAALLVGRFQKSIIRPTLGYAKLPGLSIKQIIFACHGSDNLTSAEISDELINYIIGLLKSREADACKLGNLMRTSALYASACRLPNIMMRDHAPKTLHRWRLQLPENYEAFLKLKSGDKRYKLKSYVRNFEKEFGPDIEYKLFTGVNEVDQFCTATEQIASTTYHRGLGVGFLNNGDTYRRISTAAAKGWLRARVLYVKNQPIAFWQGELFKDVLYYIATGYIPAFRKNRVGTVLLLKDIESLCEQHVRVIDFGLGMAQYKEEICNEYLPEAEVNVYAPSYRGLCANLINCSTNIANDKINLWLKRIGLLDIIKSGWRRRKQSKLLIS